ncbi:3-hydroxyisobutyrate dehydrogenase [Nocardioides szechwanensis]|uniref:3-hydroxyisobutyrate dehydrogenase n=1 Tax=Nocardioides szechwanensis TaxID=1005944 RepID=A0A1H0GZK8_9ACTN|nr:NAD(P)-dependent oxidoreductase [Nocardioides szechwanensis]GEP34124.1 3-hydroxyisobutyrate dehydrogenase [Nocardioides szechwanensis]SDO12357.1 3-hydroxyisobutyrate dehydrogenase [Nocardioides szechwanensis]
MQLTTPPRIGFIGLGSMGSGMTRNLLRAGFPLVVHDTRTEVLEEYAALGAEVGASPAAVAAASDAVITMLPTPAIVSEVVNGPDGILAGLRDGGTWIDMSTSVPAVADDVRRRTAGRGIVVLDAPVSGMAVGAASGRLQIFVGGDAEEVERWRPVLEAMGDPDRILHVGSHGAGYAAKLMINQLWFSHLVATAEVLAVGVKAGVRLDVLRSALIASPANSNFLERDVLSILEHSDYDEGFAIALACKDLGLATDLAAAVGVPVELSALVGQVYRRARASYGDQAGEMTPFQLYEDLLGHPLRLTVSTPETLEEVAHA